MAKNNLQSIKFEHVLYGASKTLNPDSTSEEAPIQVEEIERAVKAATRLIQTHEGHDTGKHETATKKKAASKSKEKYDEDDHHAAQEGSYALAQVVSLYNATVTDGRYIDDLIKDPAWVAHELGMELSEEAAFELVSAGQAVNAHFGPRADFALGTGKKIVAAAVVVFIAIRAETKPYDVVIDSSGLVKV